MKVSTRRYTHRIVTYKYTNLVRTLDKFQFIIFIFNGIIVLLKKTYLISYNYINDNLLNI